MCCLYSKNRSLYAVKMNFAIKGAVVILMYILLNRLNEGLRVSYGLCDKY
jgi:hypothetical protein